MDFVSASEDSEQNIAGNCGAMNPNEFTFLSNLIKLVKENDFITKFNKKFLFDITLEFTPQEWVELMNHFNEIANLLNGTSNNTQIVSGE